MNWTKVLGWVSIALFVAVVPGSLILVSAAHHANNRKNEEAA